MDAIVVLPWPKLSGHYRPVRTLRGRIIDRQSAKIINMDAAVGRREISRLGDKSRGEMEKEREGTHS